MRSDADWTRRLRRLGVLAGGALLLALGLVLLLTPGPGLLTLAAGLGVLSAEFESLSRLRSVLASRIRGLRGRGPHASTQRG